MSKLNAEQISEMEIFRKQASTRYEYREDQSISLFGFKLLNRPAGFYDKFYSSPQLISAELLLKLNEDVYIEGQRVFNKPYIRITMGNGNEYDEIFETIADLDEFIASEIIKDLKFIGE